MQGRMLMQQNFAQFCLQKVERRRGKRWKRPRLISINIYVMLNIGTSLKNQKWITSYITGKSTTGVKRYLVHMAFCFLEHSWTIQNSSSQFYYFVMKMVSISILLKMRLFPHWRRLMIRMFAILNRQKKNNLIFTRFMLA